MQGLAAAANNLQHISYFWVLVSQLVRSALLLGGKKEIREEKGINCCVKCKISWFTPKTYGLKSTVAAA